VSESKKPAKILLDKTTEDFGLGVQHERTFDCTVGIASSCPESSRVHRLARATHNTNSLFTRAQVARRSASSCCSLSEVRSATPCHGCSLSAHRLMPPMCAFD